MTQEGIIQKVFNNHSKKITTFKEAKIIQEIQDELIERIKQEVSHFGCWQCVGSEDVKGVELEDLIGDRTLEPRKCDYSGCKSKEDAKEFYSYEEGTVYLCKKHREINEDLTGYTVKRTKQDNIGAGKE